MTRDGKELISPTFQVVGGERGCWLSELKPQGYLGNIYGWYDGSVAFTFIIRNKDGGIAEDGVGKPLSYVWRQSFDTEGWLNEGGEAPETAVDYWIDDGKWEFAGFPITVGGATDPTFEAGQGLWVESQTHSPDDPVANYTIIYEEFVFGNITNPTMYIYMSTASGSTLSTERKNLLAALKSNDTPTGWVEKYDLTSGNLAQKTLPTDSTVGAAYSFYGVIIGEDSAGNEYAFFTGNASGKQAALASDGGTSVSLTQSATALRPIGSTSAASAAWYTIKTAAVPEPTSGLLLLLDVAGLALRRRRA